MGVQGLQTIVKYHGIYFRSTILKDTKLVIDGDSLVFFMYENIKIDLKHGGDYDDFANAIRLFFSRLSSCGIEPYVVLDGGYEEDRRKHETTVQRSRSRIGKAEAVGEHETVTFAPMLVWSTFLNVLGDMKLPFVVCDFDADHEIVLLANKFRCPVLSRDSDFYIFEIKKGYIPLDWFQLKNCCACKIFLCQDIADFLRIKPTLLPVLAVSLGNDYVRRKYLYSFYKTLPWRQPDGSFLTSVQRKVVTWLRTKIDPLQDLTTKLPDLKSCIQLSYDMYSKIADFDSFDLMHYFKSKRTESDSKLDDFHRRGKIPVWIKNARLLHHIFLMTQVENLKSRSIHRCSKRLRAVMYELLSTGPVLEYDRDRSSLVRFKVYPLKVFDDLQSLPNLQSLLQMNAQDKIDFLCNVFRLTKKDSLLRFPQNIKLLILVLVYWVKHAKPRVNSCFLDCLLFCHFRLLAKSGKATALTIPKLGEKELEHFVNKTDRFCTARDAFYDIKIVHGFSQFQSCLEFGNSLNQLLECPVPCIKPELVYNGSFLSNMYSQLVVHNDDKGEITIEEEINKTLQPTFLENGGIGDIYQEIKSIVKSEVIEARWQVQIPKKTFDVRLSESWKMKNTEALPFLIN